MLFHAYDRHFLFSPKHILCYISSFAGTRPQTRTTWDMMMKSSESSAVGVGGGGPTVASSAAAAESDPLSLKVLRKKWLGGNGSQRQRRHSQSSQRLAFSRRDNLSVGSSGGVFTSMRPQSQAGEESNFVGGSGSGSNPSASELGGEGAEITTTTQVRVDTCVKVSFSIVFLSLSSFSFIGPRLAHIDLLNRLSYSFPPITQSASFQITGQHCRYPRCGG